MKILEKSHLVEVNGGLEPNVAGIPVAFAAGFFGRQYSCDVPLVLGLSISAAILANTVQTLYIPNKTILPMHVIAGILQGMVVGSFGGLFSKDQGKAMQCG